LRHQPVDADAGEEQRDDAEVAAQQREHAIARDAFIRVA
jgi:hypothetical protein